MNIIILHRAEQGGLPIYLNTTNICAWGSSGGARVKDYASWIAVHDPNRSDYFVRETPEEILHLIHIADRYKK